MRHHLSRQLSQSLLALSLSLPVLAGCNAGQTGLSADLSSATGSFSTLSTDQAATVSQDILPAIAAGNDVQTANADAQDVLQNGPSASAYGYQDRPGPGGGSRHRHPQMGLNRRGDGGMQLGDPGAASQAIANPGVVAYDATKKVFTLTTTIEQPKNFRNFSATSTHVQTYDAAKLDAAVDPATITTADALKKLNLTLLESDSTMTLTNPGGTDTAKRTEAYSGGTVTIHEEISRGSSSTRLITIVRDSTLDQASNVETGKSTTTVTQSSKVVSTVNSTFTFQHSTGAGSQTAVSAADNVQVSVNTDASGNQSGSVTTTAGGGAQQAGSLQGDGSGHCHMATASGSQDLPL